MSIKVKDPRREVKNLNKIFRDQQVYLFHQIKLVSPFDGRYRLSINKYINKEEIERTLPVISWAASKTVYTEQDDD